MTAAESAQLRRARVQRVFYPTLVAVVLIAAWQSLVVGTSLMNQAKW